MRYACQHLEAVHCGAVYLYARRGSLSDVCPTNSLSLYRLANATMKHCRNCGHPTHTFSAWGCHEVTRHIEIEDNFTLVRIEGDGNIYTVYEVGEEEMEHLRQGKIGINIRDFVPEIARFANATIPAPQYPLLLTNSTANAQTSSSLSGLDERMRDLSISQQGGAAPRNSHSKNKSDDKSVRWMI